MSSSMVDSLCPWTPNVISLRCSYGHLRRKYKCLTSFELHTVSKYGRIEDAGHAMSNTCKSWLEWVPSSDAIFNSLLNLYTSGYMAKKAKSIVVILAPLRLFSAILLKSLNSWIPPLICMKMGQREVSLEYRLICIFLSIRYEDSDARYRIWNDSHTIWCSVLF